VDLSDAYYMHVEKCHNEIPLCNYFMIMKKIKSRVFVYQLENE
jgi:hypothetical protein